MLIYTNTHSKKTRKQKLKQKEKWNQWLSQYKLNTDKLTPTQRKPTQIPIRPGALDYKQCRSLDTNTIDTFKKPTKQYTGENIVGISTMHKSNAVPVFNHNHAIEISKMRRG